MQESGAPGMSWAAQARRAPGRVDPPDLPPPSPSSRTSPAQGPAPGTVNGVAQATLVLQFLALSHLQAQRGSDKGRGGLSSR